MEYHFAPNHPAIVGFVTISASMYRPKNNSESSKEAVPNLQIKVKRNLADSRSSADVADDSDQQGEARLRDCSLHWLKELIER